MAPVVSTAATLGWPAASDSAREADSEWATTPTRAPGKRASMARAWRSQSA